MQPATLNAIHDNAPASLSSSFLPLQRICSLPPPSLSTHEARSASLELVQYVNRIRAVQVQLLRPTSTANVFYNVVWVRSANDWNLRRKPLLKWLGCEVPIRREPSCHCCANLELLLWVGVVGGGPEDDVAFVDGNVLLGRRRDTNLARC